MLPASGLLGRHQSAGEESEARPRAARQERQARQFQRVESLWRISSPSPFLLEKKKKGCGPEGVRFSALLPPQPTSCFSLHSHTFTAPVWLQSNTSFFLFLFLFLLLLLLLVHYHPSEFSEMHALGNERRGRREAFSSLLGKTGQRERDIKKQSKGWPSIYFFPSFFLFLHFFDPVLALPSRGHRARENQDL